MKHIDVKKLIIKALPFVLFFYLFGKCGQAFRLAQGVDLSGKLLNISGGFAAAFQNPLPSIHPQDLLVGAIGAAFIALALNMKKQNAKKYAWGWSTAARGGEPRKIGSPIQTRFLTTIFC